MSSSENVVFASGCFWCTEAVFQQLNGIITVESGYTGGKRENPNYESVSTGVTGHAEALRVEFDPNIITFETLLDVFFSSHDPTTLNRQGNDIGTQYRSGIFYTNEAQKQSAERYLQQLTTDQIFSNSIVTTIEPLMDFYPAEKYHQNYYATNPNQPYCQFVINPKVAKIRKKFSHLLR